MNDTQDLPVPLPAVWDRIAEQNPNRVVVSIPLGPEVQDGYRDVTALEMSNAIRRACWFLEDALGRSDTFQTLCYLGPSDLRYPILMAAGSKLGYKTFWTSPRNSFEGHVQLMQATECKLFLTPAVVPPGIGPVIEKLHMQHVIIPELAVWLDSVETVRAYPFSKTYEQCKLEPFTIIHTSGSTGFPKPICIPHGFPCALEAIVNAPHPPNKKNIWRWMSENPGRLYTPFPMFHGAGLILFHHYSQFLHLIPVLPPPNKPITAELSNEIISSGLVDTAFLAPAIIDAIAKVSEYTESLRRLRFIVYAGAPISKEVGDIISKKTTLFSTYGQTETGLLHQFCVDSDDFAYVDFGDLSNVVLRHHVDDLYEAVMVRKPGLEVYQAGFMFDTESTEIRTHDLFSRHPDPAKPDLWVHRGRADDVIVFDTGEKINPTSMEALINSHALVRSSMVVGQGRFQSALLIEPVTAVATPETKAALLDSVWPIIEEANRDCPAHGCVMRSHVLFTRPDLPFPRTAKETIKRASVVEVYKDAIDHLYQTASLSNHSTAFTINPTASKEEFIANIRSLVQISVSLEALSDDTNLYQLGMDSLQTLQLSRSLKASLSKSQIDANAITPRFVYSHPTVRQLSEGLYNLSNANPGQVQAGSQIEEMRATLSEYSQRLPEICKTSPSVTPSGMTVLLTGSTGSLGSYILHSLLQQASVRHVFCLNRSADAASRQAASNEARGLQDSLDTGRVTFHTCDFSQPLLGLPKIKLDEMLGQVTHIIHNAWTVNFNLTLSSLAPTNIAGLTTLIQFAADSVHHSQIFFVSSIGTVTQYKQAGHLGDVPEELIDDPRVAGYQGYAQSKWVSEHLLRAAQEKVGIDVCCLRVGQIAAPIGTEKGAWNSTEWFPLFLRSCKSLGLLPRRLPVSNKIDWIPVNVLATAIVELVQRGASDQGCVVYNLVNPATTTWEEIFPVVQRRLSSDVNGERIKLVDYADWVRALEQVASENMMEKDIQANPAIKLLEFFQDLEGHNEGEGDYGICSDKTAERSSALKECGPVSAEWMSLWIDQLGLGGDQERPTANGTE